MNYLAIDYGLSHVGLAISEGLIAEPYKQLGFISNEKLVDDIIKICLTENIQTIIVGISENIMAVKTREFVDLLKTNLDIPIMLFDETLTSKEANKILIESGSKKKKRQEKSHQVAAALILQNYLDSL